MKKMACFALSLLGLSSLTVHATCNVTPLSTQQLSGNINNSPNAYPSLTGHVIVGEGCRGFGTRSTYTADIYSFQGKAGDTFSLSSNTPNYNGNALITLLDPQGTQIGNNVNPGLNISVFTVRLAASGLYQIVITGYNADVDPSVNNGTLNYAMILSSTSPAQTATCPSDTYNNGVLSINSVSVPNGTGGNVNYSATLTLQPLSNPMTFILNQATPVQ